ncbi:MAG: retropepsin-like aspartic protease [Gemmatimonadota bacterium]
MKGSIVLMAGILAGCGSSAAPAEPPVSTGGGLEAFLKQSGYSSVEMSRLPTGHFSVSGTADSVRFDLILDTGASHTIIDTERADRFNLMTRDRGGTATGLGVSGQRIESGQLDNVALGAVRFARIPVAVVDLSEVNGVLERLGNAPVDGVIGADVLMSQQAVIDYGSLNLYLKE